MAPKARPRVSLDKDQLSMPPPPVPATPSAILESEIKALSETLKRAAVKTGQIYQFYADTKRIGSRGYAPEPPKALTTALSHEVERYDQLCDVMEFHLNKSIAVLSHKLQIEQQLAKEVELKAAEAAKLAKEAKMVTDEPSPSREAEPKSLDVSMSTSPPQPPRMQPSASSSAAGRRPSAISISSLHRPSLPPRLDLSNTQLRLSADDTPIFTSGLASPVTLAPKSARPMDTNDMPADFMTVFGPAPNPTDTVDIDLTVPDDNPLPPSINMDRSLGNSADKPIELDLESMDMEIDMMSELFGDDTESDAGAVATNVEELFNNMGSKDTTSNGEGGADPSQDLTGKEAFDPFGAIESADTPNTVMATLAAAAAGSSEQQREGTQAPPGFDISSIDLATFLDDAQGSADMMMDMEQLLSMTGGTGEANASTSTARETGTT
ncbi:hypothetical protein BDV98DRAFT_559153 [Pterulicium gracile]|uniref:Uncharacterized protein n=1 Tax=Pterulicium gracile TaxID=1884261 RepID=A0A5C3QWJ0_9AGAR|nr:hypothetical protein BDV98DRAFT_559153 [Pterula gracilis]